MKQDLRISILVSMLVMSFCFSNAAMAQTVIPNSIVGTYQIKDQDVKVKIYKEGDLYYGKTINTTTKLAEGTLILKDLKYGEGCWKGVLFIAAINKGFDCIIDQELSAGIKVVVTFGVLKKSQIWVRIKNSEIFVQ